MCAGFKIFQSELNKSLCIAKSLLGVIVIMHADARHRPVFPTVLPMGSYCYSYTAREMEALSSHQQSQRHVVRRATCAVVPRLWTFFNK